MGVIFIIAAFLPNIIWHMAQCHLERSCSAPLFCGKKSQQTIMFNVKQPLTLTRSAPRALTQSRFSEEALQTTV